MNLFLYYINGLHLLKLFQDNDLMDYKLKKLESQLLKD